MNEKSRLVKILAVSVTFVGVIGALYHLISTQYLFQTFLEHQNNHFAFSLVLVFLVSLKKNPKRWPIYLVLILLGLVATGYVKIFFEDLQGRIGFPTNMDMVIGILLVIIALEASRQAFGPVIPILSIIAIAYDIFGHYLPDPFYHTKFTYSYVITHLSIGLDGMYGTALSVSVNYIFLFFLFGGILQNSGAIDFFTSLGNLAGRKLRGGPAQTAVVSSALIGSVTGSAVANVAITGAFTIPLMIKVGYKREHAGAIEAAASVGGQIMPPIMGAAAFLMAAVTGISYIEIMIAAIIPAALYFIAIGIFVELQARAESVKLIQEEVNIKEMLGRMPCFIVPIVLLIVLLVKGYTPMFCAFWATVILVATNFATDLLMKKRPDLKQLIKGLTVGAIGGAKIGVTSALIGFLMASMTMTGIGVKLSGMVAEWSGGVLLIACFITMLISLLFGMGVPTMVAYALVAILVAPALMRMGVPLLQAHFFCMFFAVFCNLTPPVALASLVASGISGGDYFKTAFAGFKIAIIAFILPYLMIWNPTLILQPESLTIGVMTIIAILLAMLAIGAVITNYFIVRLDAVQMVLFAICAVLLLGYAFTINNGLFIVGICLMVLLTFYQFKVKRKVEAAGGIT
ncbi:MAG: TRAP transporter fused permease subunit [Deltaproteobacteria bacterium]|nr:TRAP transporter fused permease subunit [Deltaproteobacteria bacterium]